MPAPVADPRKPKGPRVKYGANTQPTMVTPDIVQQNQFTLQAAQLADMMSQSKATAMETGGALKAEYANQLARIQKAKIAGLGTVENTALGRGIFGGSADVQGRIGVQADAASAVNEARNALQAGLMANQNLLQQTRTQFGYGTDALALQIAGAGVGPTTDAFSSYSYDPAGTGTGGTGTRPPGGNNSGWFSGDTRQYLTGNAPSYGGSASMDILKVIRDNYPEVLEWVQRRLGAHKGFQIPDADGTARQLLKYITNYYSNGLGGAVGGGSSSGGGGGKF